MMRLLTAVLILGAVVAGVVLGQETKRSYGELPYEELQRILENAVSKGDWIDVAGITGAMIEKEKEDPEPHYWLAYSQLRRGELDKALHKFDEVIGLDSDYLEAYVGRAIVRALKREDNLAEDEIEVAAGRGYPVREMLAIPELKPYLERPKFFIKAIMAENPSVSPGKIDPFGCPCRIKEDVTRPRVERFDVHPEAEQRKRRDDMRKLYAEIDASIVRGDDNAALEKFRALKGLYTDDVKTGKISRDEIRAEMESLWDNTKRTFLPQIIRIVLERLKREAEKALVDLQNALHKKDLDGAGEIDAKLESYLREKIEDPEPEFEPVRKEARVYDARREVMHKKVVILREFRDKVSPHIRLSGIITGEKRCAFLETNFDGRREMHSVSAGDCPIPDLIIEKIEENRIAAKYKEEPVEIVFSQPAGGASDVNSKTP